MRDIWGLAADLALITLFAIIGRASHDEGLTLSGVAWVAWPFWAGCILGWVLVLAVPRTRAAGCRLVGGLLVWPSTLIIGMLLRVLTGQGVAWTFVLVAAIALAILLLGWRFALLAVRQLTRPKCEESP